MVKTSTAKVKRYEEIKNYYYYDENGNKTYWELEMSGTIFQRAEFTYNEENLLACELGLSSDFSGGFNNSWKIDYTYDKNNYITQIDEYYWENGAGKRKKKKK